MKRVLSLFDHTGRWSQPYYDAGYDVLEVDLQNYVAIDIRSITSAEQALDELGDFDIILAAPPCTDFAVSGARWWKSKDAGWLRGFETDTERSVELVRQVLRLVNLYQPTDDEYLAEHGPLIWAVENPVGRIADLVPELGEPWYFDPCDFAGYVCERHVLRRLAEIRAKNGQGVSMIETQFVMENEAYTKRTGLWGHFTRPALNRVEPVRCCATGTPLQRFGGKSTKTKNARSATPLGFARAFFEANR